MYLLLQWIVTSLTIAMVPYLVSGVSVDSFPAAIAGAAILGVLNMLVKPILFLLTLPITVLTLGVFYLLLNALMFKWMGALVSGVHVDSFGAAFLGSIIVSLVSWIFSVSFRKEGGAGPRIVIRKSGPRQTRDLN